MSFVADDPNDPNSNQSQVDKATNAQSNAAPKAASDDPSVSASGGGAGGVVSAGSPTTPDKPSSSGSWTNLNSYLNANADQGAKVGGDIAQNVNNQGQQAQSDIANLGSNFNNAVQANTVNQDQNAVNDAVTAATTTGNLTPDQIANFQKQSGASYGGPNDVTSDAGYGKLASDVGNTMTAAQQAQSEAGRGVLLNSQYQNASLTGYNQGENKLDQLLLENTPGAQQSLSPLAQKWSGLGSSLGNIVSSGNAAAAQAKATDTSTAQAAQGALSNATNTFQSGLTKQVADMRASQSDLQSRILAQEKTGNFDPDVAQALGITNGQKLYNVDLSKANGTFDPSSITDANTATTQQYAQAQALAQLAGQQQSALLPNTNIGSAGTASGPSVDQRQINQQLAQAGSQYQDLVGPGFQALSPYFQSLSGQTSLDLGAPTNPTDPASVYNYINSLNALENTHPAYADAFQGPGTVGQAYQGVNNWENLYQALNPTRVAQINGAAPVSTTPKRVMV